jgi:hypothetical protein
MMSELGIPKTTLLRKAPSAWTAEAASVVLADDDGVDAGRAAI